VNGLDAPARAQGGTPARGPDSGRRPAIRATHRLRAPGGMEFPPRRIAGFVSEVLVLGGVPEKGDVVLLQPDQAAPNGTVIA
jgi:hypothetical protein